MSCTNHRRVVVTGLGLVTPMGIGTSKNWEALSNGKSGIGPVTHFDASAYASQVAGEVKDFDPADWLSPKDIKKADRFIHLGIAAADEAIQQAGLEKASDELKEKTAVILGSGMGGLVEIEKTKETLMERGPRRVSPFFIPAILPNLLAGQVSIRNGFKGPNICTVSACASGAHAIGDAFLSIKRGESNAAITGGAEGCVSPLTVAGFSAMKALSTQFNSEPMKASRPFDENRDGFVMAEGAGVLVLEEMETAKARGANILAEMVGFGQTGDAYHLTSPSENGEGGQRAMKAALDMANLTPEDIQYVNAHATSTPAGDEIESQAIEAVFGQDIKISATKSMTGHMLGAAGGAEAAFSILALNHQVAPPTINLDNPSENCRLDYVPNTAQDLKMQAVLSNSFGFGGTNASLIFKKI